MQKLSEKYRDAILRCAAEYKKQRAIINAIDLLDYLCEEAGIEPDPEPEPTSTYEIKDSITGGSTTVRGVPNPGQEVRNDMVSIRDNMEDIMSKGYTIETKSIIKKLEEWILKLDHCNCSDHSCSS
jgi:hypothetical protein